MPGLAELAAGPHRAGPAQPSRGAVMTPAVTAGLLHDLVTDSHAKGITALGVEAAIEHDDRVLLIVQPGPDFTDDTWQLPGGPVLPGQTLTDALHPAVAAIGLAIDEITGYLGHHDHPGDWATTRVFRFAVTVTDPGAICRHAGTGHHWAEDLDCPPGDPAGLPGPVITPAAGEPPLAGQLRAWAAASTRRGRHRAAHRPRRVPEPRGLHQPLHQHPRRRRRPGAHRLARPDRRLDDNLLFRRREQDAPAGSQPRPAAHPSTSATPSPASMTTASSS